jgi:uncharacterized damage-inducible protein DinB
MRISDGILPEFDQESATTRKVLERCPEDKYGWKPHTKSFSMAQLATHLANTAGWAVLVLTEDSFDYAPPGAPPFKEDPAGTKKELLERFDKNIAAAREALAKTEDEQFMQPWTLLGGGNPVFTMPRIGVVRSMIMNHMVHHRAQLGVYLRLNDVPVPMMYGPTADEG